MMEFNFSKLMPQSKPKPDLSNLTPYELEQLQKVFEKQEKFEKELQSSIKYELNFLCYSLKRLLKDFLI